LEHETPEKQDRTKKDSIRCGARASGPNVRRGAITKAGNPHVRRLLAETAWAYQGILDPRISAASTVAKTSCRRNDR
jgi:transposase